MDLRFVDQGTQLNFLVCSYGDDAVLVQHRGAFWEMENRTTVMAECEGLYDEANEPAEDTYLRIEFFHGSVNRQRPFAFNGKFLGRTHRYGRPMILISQTSECKEGARRAMPRIEMSVPVSVDAISEAPEGELPSAKGFTMDVSADGMGLLSNDQLNPDDTNHTYKVTFAIGASRPFTLIARLLHRKDSTTYVQYKYEYGFLFDHSNNKEERARLITSMLDYRLSRA